MNPSIRRKKVSSVDEFSSIHVRKLSITQVLVAARYAPLHLLVPHCGAREPYRLQNKALPFRRRKTHHFVNLSDCTPVASFKATNTRANCCNFQPAAKGACPRNACSMFVKIRGTACYLCVASADSPCEKCGIALLCRGRDLKFTNEADGISP